ncbi:hypothetical protein D1816_02755 [Aquimarina sp. AD10]|uniref:Uncharacterized protein n=1 Tax=Aquimarina aggregata TaxID=1642818 RepID=A0A163CRL4_9FLAO|nr:MULTISPECIES: hypothetical protein [Aquimarina]AXT59309.1 hypothetical protein D1816_02755 [Aquimarina sp. AD10]KZS42691.1 hypothetical protein AWE51_04370 [Aquimarina aggregata]RKM95184.1 hypothetical protein D7033_17235 [Aquimarina sp. AD10]
MNIEVIPLVISLIPAILITLVSVYFFKLHTSNEEKRRRFLLYRENQKEALPLKLQAYERIALFLERISPGKLLQRMEPVGDNKKNYEVLLIHAIDQEYEHNLTQQIYISDECWNTVKTAKNAIISLIRKVTLDETVDSTDRMREIILTTVIEKGSPSEIALAAVKSDVNDLFSI